MKKKSLATLLSGFLTVCLTGVGFAAWVITGGDEANIDNGTVNVETVSDQRVTIRKCNEDELNTITDKDLNIKFGHEANDSISNPWFKWDSTNGVLADKTAKIPFYIKNHNHANIDVDYDEKLKELTGISTPDDKTDDYISLSFHYVEPTSVDSETKEGLAYIELSYEWGEAFGKNNPYTYYNNLDCSDELVNEIFNLFGTTGKFTTITAFSITIIGTYHD